MEEEYKILANQIVKNIERKVRSTILKEPFKLGKTIDIGADGTAENAISAVKLAKKLLE